MIPVTFRLIAESAAAIPLTLLEKDQLSAWTQGAAPRERAWVTASGFTAEAGRVALLPDAEGGVARVLVGKAAEDEVWALGGLPESLPEGAYRIDGTLEPAKATRLALGWALGTYAFTRYKERKPGKATLVWPDAADRHEVERLARGISLARDLINTPAGDMGPAELAAAAQELAARTGAACSVIIGDDLLAQNYPTIHAVGRASTRAPRLIDLTFGDPGAPKVTLVGKGVCFDTGGLDLKPASGMRMMKKDMGGAATVLGLASALIDAKLPIRLRVLIPAVENSVAGNAFRPLDIIKTRKGITVEVGNTDAEGRLILCDALAEADGEKPALLIDMATLTGAARVALGPDLPALFCNDDAVAADLLKAGESESDPLWRLPLWRPYRKMLDSKIADINNVSESGFAGAILAAIYMQDFVSATTPWVHVDTFAWNQSTRPGRPEGGEALALRAIDRLIRQRFG